MTAPNETLTRLKDRRRTLVDEMTRIAQTGVKYGRDLSTNEDRRFTELNTEVDQISERLTELEATEQRAADTESSFAELAARPATLGATGSTETAPYSLVPGPAQLAELAAAIGESRAHRIVLGREGSEEQRATLTLATTGGMVGPIAGPLAGPRRLLSAVGIPTQDAPSSGVSGPLFGVHTPTAGTAEGSTKPEAGGVTAQTVAIKALARWTDMSKHGALSGPSTVADITSWHAQAIALDEDKLIIDALNTAAGSAVAFAADVTGAVKGQMATIEATIAQPVDVVLVHPDNYALVAGFSATNADDVASKVVMFGSAVVYPSLSVPTGFILVAALAAIGRFYVTMGPAIDTFESLKDNVLTVRTEELVGFGVRQSGGVKKIDVVTP